MKNKYITNSDLAMMVILFAVALIRVFNNASPNLEALANFSPVAAMALFGAVKSGNYIKSLLVPVLALLVSDLLLYATVYSNYSDGFLYGGWYWVYGAFVLMAMAAKLIVKKVTMASVATAVLVTVFIHWVVTDFGAWLGSTVYPQTMTGFVACLAAAIPFELRLLAATIFYSGIMFGLSHLLLHRMVTARK